MSTTVDNRVVEMQFNNSQFESNVKTSLNTIEKLKESLNFSGVANSFDSITSSSEKVDMSGLSSAVENVRVKFSALEVIAVTALANVTNSAIETGKQLISSLSVDNIADGWEKFANKTQSVGTLISQGFDLDSVTEQLERLNWYTDETSYNFTDMVANIAKFTASGRDLETSVTAMEGIANWAALSGQNATTASQAMYQLAQAMSAGYMRLEDYKSIQNASMDTAEFRQKCLDAAVALGTLQDNLDGTYTSLVNGGDAFSLSQFTTNLTKGAWLTSDVMMEVFNEYSSAVDQIYDYAEEKGITASEAIEELGDSVDEFGLKAFKAAQEARTWADVVDSVKDAVSTGWMNTFEIIFGNYEEATELWTDLANAMYDVFAAGAEDRNEMLETWKELGGRTVLIDAFWTAWDNIGEILGTVKEAFREVFPSTTAEQLYSMTEGLKNLADKLKMSDENLDNLKSTFKGVFAVIDIVKQAVLALWGGVTTLLGGVGSLTSGVLGLTGSFGDWLVSIDDAIKESDIFNTVVQTVVSYIQGAIAAVIEFAKAVKEWLDLPDLSTITSSVSNFISTVKEKFATPGFDLLKTAITTISDLITGAIDSIFDLKDTTSSAFDEMGNTVSNSTFVKVLGAIWNGIVTVATAIKNLLGDAVSGLVSAIGNADFESFFSVLNDLLTGGILVSVIELIHNFATGLGDMSKFVKKLESGTIDILNNFGSVLESWSTSIKADAILKIAAAVGILAIALIALTGVDSEELSTSVTAITALCVDLVAAMTALQKLTGTSSSGPVEAVTSFIDSFSNAKQYSNMIKMAAAIGILAAALTLLASADQGNLAISLAAITGLFADLTVSMIALNKLGGATSGLTTMIGIAAAIYILSSAIKSLSDLYWDDIKNGLIAVTTLCVELVAAMIALNKLGGSTKGAVAMIALAAAIKILASACEDFAGMSWGEIAKGLTSVGVLLAELAAFAALTGNANSLISTGLALIEIAAAMKIFASAVADFGKLSWGEIAKGLVAMGAALAEVTVAVKLMPNNMVSLASGMVIMGAALEIIADALENMGGMSWGEIAKGLVTMGVALAEMAVALKAMSGTLSGSAALLVAAAAIDLLTPALKALGNMSIAQIAKSLITLAGAFTVIGVAAAVLSPLTTTILALAAAFTLIGVSVAAVGVGLVAAGAGISSIAVGITALAASLAVSLTAIVSGIETIVLSIVSLIPDILIAIGEGIIGICDVIAGGATSIGAAVKAIVLALVDVLVECVPALASGALEMLLGVVDALVDYAPQIVEALMQLIIGIIEAIAANIPDLVLAVMDLFGALFSAIVDAINGMDTGALLEGIVCVGLLSALVVALSAIAGLVPGAMVALAELGVLVAEMAAIFAAIGALAQIPGLTWLVGEGAALLEGIGTAIGSFVGGIVGGFMSGVSSQFAQIGSDLSAFMENVQPFIEGASKIDASTMDGVKALAETILVLTAADVLEGLTSWFTGGSSIADFGKEIAEFGPYFSDYYEAIKGIDGGVVEASANAALALAEMADKLPNSGGVVGWFAGENSLATFAEELAEFGPSLKSYADSVDGLDADVVVNSANAALALAEMASKLPNSGGVVGWFTGENSLSVFAEELAEFGPKLKEYAESVDGLDSNVVIESSNAALALAEMAGKLPNQNGIVSWFTGDNTLSAFGAELAAFGPHLSEYAASIDGVDSDVVIGSANAASALAEMAGNLPDQGGILSWFTGENTLSAFGEELAEFGPKLKEYSESVDGFDADLVTNSANAAKTLFEMAANLPEQGGILSWFTGENTLSAFAEELAVFGPQLKEYSDSVTGVDSGIVESSANAGKALFEMAENLPDQGGVAGWFTGSNTLSEFAAELEEFGPKLKAYSDSVNGVSNAVVTNSANAAKALFEMAENLPDQGGIVNWFTGSNTLSEFAEELEAFGPKLKAYFDSVIGVSSSVVTNSANAAKALFEMAENLPDQGGVVGWFKGDNTLSAFGEELSIFGPYLAEYADSVAGVSAEVVTNSANAAKALAELANNLPDSGGLLSFFTGDNDIAEFGEKLVSFGNSFAEYYASVSGINTDVLSDVVVEFKKLVELATGISDIDTSGMSNFAQSLKKLGNSGIDEFIGAFDGASSKVTTAATNMLNTFINGVTAKQSNVTTTFTNLVQAVLTAINAKQSEFQTAGSNVMTKFIAGVKSQDNNSRTTFTTIISGCLTAIKNKYTEFNSVGAECMTKLIAGVKSKDSSLTSAFTTCVSSAVSAVKDYYSNFYSAGSYLVDGFAAGISENSYKAEAKARAMAKAAADAAEDELDINSPSKVGYSIGNYFGVGFVNAIGDYADKAYTAGSEMASSAKTGLSNTISKVADLVNGDLNLEPTIRPVLDLTDVEEGTSRLNALFSRTQAQSISADMNSDTDGEIQNGNDLPAGGNKWEFNQYNYSPKSLSRAEIYRQTKNQFSALERMVET